MIFFSIIENKKRGYTVNPKIGINFPLYFPVLTMLAIFVLSFSPVKLIALSSVVKAQQLRMELLSQIRQLDIIIENFGDEKLTADDKELIFGKHYSEYDTNYNLEKEYNAYIPDKKERENFDFKKEYQESRAIFDKATITFFSRNYIAAEIMFLETKWRLIKLLKGLSFLYLKKTQVILDEAALTAVKKIVEYGPQNDKLRIFKVVYDPLRDVLLYNPKEYNFVMSRVDLNNFLEKGFRLLHQAKTNFGYKYRFFYKDEKGNIKTEKTAKTDKLFFNEYLTNFDSDLKVNWLQIINDNRKAKLYAFEIFRLLNKYRFNGIMNRYRIPPEKVDEIFDDRIPDVFQVDFIDAIRKAHATQMYAFEKHLQANWLKKDLFIQMQNGKPMKVSGLKIMIDDINHDEKNQKEEPDKKPVKESTKTK
jgi:hypothetical protein